LETTKEVLIEIHVLPDEKTKCDKELSELEAKTKEDCHHHEQGYLIKKLVTNFKNSVISSAYSKGA
jgi:hypothetical protein